MASKFSMVNTSGMFDTASHIEASDRMQDAMEELKLKHEQQDRIKQTQQRIKEQQEKEHIQRTQRSQEAAMANALRMDDSFIRARPEEEEEEEEKEKGAEEEDEDQEDDEDAALMEGLEQDPELARLRANRLTQLKKEYLEKQELISKGHGESIEIVQDEFLKQVTSSKWVLIHFYHPEFERCKLMDMHLKRLATTHLECKFLKINAEKAPFFVEKLKIKVLPTIIGFQEGIACQMRLIGFHGLKEKEEEEEEKDAYGSRLNYRIQTSDTFRTVTLAKRLIEMGILNYNEVDEEKWE